MCRARFSSATPLAAPAALAKTSRALEAVQPGAALDRRGVARDRLEGVDPPPRPDAPRRQEREETDVRADVVDDAARRHVVEQRLLYRCLVGAERDLAVTFQRDDPETGPFAAGDPPHVGEQSRKIARAQHIASSVFRVIRWRRQSARSGSATSAPAGSLPSSSRRCRVARRHRRPRRRRCAGRRRRWPRAAKGRPRRRADGRQRGCASAVVCIWPTTTSSRPSPSRSAAARVCARSISGAIGTDRQGPVTASTGRCQSTSDRCSELEVSTSIRPSRSRSTTTALNAGLKPPMA